MMKPLMVLVTYFLIFSLISSTFSAPQESHSGELVGQFSSRQSLYFWPMSMMKPLMVLVTYFLIFSSLLTESETVHLQLFTLHQSTLDQQTTNVLSLITLKLDNFSILWMLHHGSIAGHLFLGNFNNLLEVVFR